jgi:hypothetical protein
MKRNMDIIRDILLAIEAEPAGKLIRSIRLPDCYSPEEVVGHLRLAYDAGLIDGTINFHHDTIMIAVNGLSNSGHDFLDAIRTEEVWVETKEQIKKVGGSASIEILKAVAAAIATKIVMGS